ncbi:hypothetical protein ON010_g6486 [Phytophthora cinnamomi]|nr:hypothetical protein ON010_g6486 [Phytophthora cinnamomi]
MDVHRNASNKWVSFVAGVKAPAPMVSLINDSKSKSSDVGEGGASLLALVAQAPILWYCCGSYNNSYVVHENEPRVQVDFRILVTTKGGYGGPPYCSTIGGASTFVPNHANRQKTLNLQRAKQIQFTEEECFFNCSGLDDPSGNIGFREIDKLREKAINNESGDPRKRQHARDTEENSEDKRRNSSSANIVFEGRCD